MNANNHTEAQAIHSAASAAPAVLLEAADPSKNLILVPLSRLVSRPTGRNVRKTPRMSIPEPTADGYFQHVPKAAILEAVGEFAPEHVTRLAKLKKGDIASEAERLADGTGWMPAIFAVEATQQNAQEVVADEQAEAPEAVAAVADEQPQAQALAA